MYSLWFLISSCARSLIKWFLHRMTGLCELQRICYGEASGARRTQGVEKSLYLSKLPQIKNMILYMDNLSSKQEFRGINAEKGIKYALGTVLSSKKIKADIHYPFVKNFSICVSQIWGYQQLVAEVEFLRQTPYNADNLEHETKLYDLWNKIVPDEPLEQRVTKQWQDIGFQGDDPKTDFRGMGLLGLENLLFFATEYSTAASHVYSHSRHPLYGYAFAIVGINMTSMAYHLLKEGTAKTYFYSTAGNTLTVQHFHKFYSYLFYEFDSFWMECKPKNIMEFSSVKERFEKYVKSHLQDPDVTFRINLSVDTV